MRTANRRCSPNSQNGAGVPALNVPSTPAETRLSIIDRTVSSASVSIAGSGMCCANDEGADTIESKSEAHSAPALIARVGLSGRRRNIRRNAPGALRWGQGIKRSGVMAGMCELLRMEMGT
ncbi:MAG: hypothetical protein IPI01_12165 [Ignavibacteriae bacterium]|nr:hypothetical protein [Ignavibacteriota bacterium]